MITVTLVRLINFRQSRNPPLLQPSITLSQFPSPPIPSVTQQESTATSPPTYNPTLSHILSEILPLTGTLPLSLPYLNKVSFSPESKDEDLHAGVLQLPKGTVLLVTEGGISEGKLQERGTPILAYEAASAQQITETIFPSGLFNVHTLQELLSSQTLAYRFPFSQFSFPTDISCIILSEGHKSAFFKVDI